MAVLGLGKKTARRVAARQGLDRTKDIPKQNAARVRGVACGGIFYLWLMRRTSQSPKLCMACTNTMRITTTASITSGMKR